MSKILLVDGNAMLFRAYYASKYTRKMTTGNGIPTNAVYGFITMFKKALSLIQPEYVCVAWDSGKPTFRHKTYEAYKGTRKELDEELIVQMPIIREYLDSAHIFRYEQEGIEADDIIGSMSRKFPDHEIIILSSDRDLLQLIDEHVSVLLMKKGITEMHLVNEQECVESFGVKPRQIIDLKGLMGDASDNIPGVKGIGEKTALSLLREYQSIAGVYEHLDEIKGKLKEKLETGKEMADLSYYLATIVLDAPLEIELSQIENRMDSPSENEFFKKYEMKSLMNDVKAETETSMKKEIVFEVVDEFTVLKENCAFVLDMNQEEVQYATIYGLAVSDSERVEYMEWEKALKNEKLLSFLKSDCSKCVYDVKRFYHVAHFYHLTIQVDFDAMIAAFLIDNSVNSYDAFVSKYSFECESLDEIYGKKGKLKIADEQLRFDYVKHFASKLAQVSSQLKKELIENQCEHLFSDIEMPLAKVLFEMEKNGIRVEKSILDEIAQKNLEKIDECTRQIYEMAGHEFNVNSPKQLAAVLYDELGLKAGKKRSTAVDVLEKLKSQHPIIEVLMEQRKYQKLYSTYATGLVKHIQSDKRIHTTFNQCLTTTGRLSSSDPNLQNISVRDEDGKEIRKAFVANEGCVLVSADYSQIELRMLAHMAQVDKMIEAFKNEQDIHTETAMHIFHVTKEEVTSLMRRQAKAVNFGIVYGMSAFGLSEQLNISPQEAKNFIDRYFETYPNIQSFMEICIRECEEKGYVETLFHRKRYIPEIHDKNHMVREFGKRAAMNAPIQGSSADLIKVAMNAIYKKIKECGYKSKMILQIHDELIFEVPMDEVEAMKKLVSEEMENAMKLSVPLKAVASVSKNWYEAK